MKNKTGGCKQKYQYIGVLPKSVRLKEKNLWGMNDLEGVEILPPNYLEIFTLPSGFGLIAAREKGSWSLFDYKGNPVNNEQYDEIYPYYGLFSISKVRVGKKWGLINKYGQSVTSIVYQTIEKFGKGLLLKRVDANVEYIDLNEIAGLNNISNQVNIKIAKDALRKSQLKVKLKKVKTS
jgi:hypothetical protein